MSFCVNPYGLVLAALKAEEEDGRVNKLMNKNTLVFGERPLDTQNSVKINT